VTTADQAAAISALDTSLSAQIGAVNADLAQNYVTTADQTAALAALNTSLSSQIGAINADLTQNYVTTADLNSAVASSTSTLTTQVNGLSTSVTVLSSSVNGVTGTHGLRIDNNGAVSGYGLISDLINNQPVSDFFVNSNNFRVGLGSNTGQYDSPFQVIGSDTYIRNATIQNAAVDTLKIAGNAVTVPVFATGSTLTGNGQFQHAVTAFVTLPQTGDIFVMWSVRHGYFQGQQSWGYQIKENGTVIDNRTNMVFGNDYPSGTFLIRNRSGPRSIRFEWMGGHSSLQGQVSLFLLGRMR
jgi:hypothetical protein